MEVTAKARFIRMSPRKVRLVADLIRGLDVDKAEVQLNFSVKAAARPVLKLLRSAIANAEHNHKLEHDNLFVKVITVDGGPMLKRWRARAFGRAAPIRKRTSHINIVLSERGAPEGKEEKAGLKAALVKKETKDKKLAVKKAEKKEDKKPAVKKSVAVKKTEKKEGKKSVTAKKTKKTPEKPKGKKAKNIEGKSAKKAEVKPVRRSPKGKGEKTKD